MSRSVKPTPAAISKECKKRIRCVIMEPRLSLCIYLFGSLISLGERQPPSRSRAEAALGCAGDPPYQEKALRPADPGKSPFRTGGSDPVLPDRRQPAPGTRPSGSAKGEISGPNATYSSRGLRF